MYQLFIHFHSVIRNMHTSLSISQQKTNPDSSFAARYKSSQDTRSSFKSTIQKKILFRLVVAGTLISIVLASAVFFIELQRLGRLVNNRASEIATRFNAEVHHLLDDPKLGRKAALRNKLKVLSIAGKMNLGMGHVIYAEIYDLDGNPIVIERDTLCTYQEAVDDIMLSFDHHLPKNSRKYHKYRTINGKPHIQLTYPLTNSKGEQAAVIEGLFAVSRKTIDEVVRRIMRTVLEAIGIVMLTTLILYPIIITLFRRLSTLTDSLLQANIETLRVLGSAVAKRDSDTDIHNYRVTIYSVKLAEAHGLHYSLIQKLIKGAFLHDVGKIGISDQILLKPGKLTERECEIMKRHVNYGIDIIRHSEWLKDASDVVKYHHEQFAGGGYPAGLKGDSIPITARIFAIADVFDALTSSRPYKDPMPFEDAMGILADGRNNHFDPFLLDTFITIAKSLYEAISSCTEQSLHQRLESITRQYFSREMYKKS